MNRALGRGSGHAIAIALVVLVLVAAAGTAIAVSLQLEARGALQESRRIHLVALGDAAVAEAMAEISRSGNFRGAAERPFGNGTIASQVRAVGANRLEIVATATVRGWEQRVVAVVAITGAAPALVSWRVEPASAAPGR